MKTRLVIILGLSFFFNRGLMAEDSHQPIPSNWIVIQDEESGLRAEFPHNPVEMNMEFPFQNTPPKGQLRFFSSPTSKGLLALATFHSSTFNEEEIGKEQLKGFFETVLVPHLFFKPVVFTHDQTYDFQHTEEQREAFFQFSFLDKGILKRLEGIATIDEHTLYIAFYLASESDFDQEVYQRFLNSIQFPNKF